MFLGFNQTIWYYQFPIDFRKQVDGLVLLIADKLERDPVSGQLFIFRNRQSNKLKLLWWDHHGFWLLYRRIEKGRFKLPAWWIRSSRLMRINSVFYWRELILKHNTILKK